jgi:hypothetical protein
MKTELGGREAFMNRLSLALLMILSACAQAPAPISRPVYGEYVVSASGKPGWTFGCAWAGTCDRCVEASDAIGKYVETTIHTQSQGVPITERIRKYQDRPVSLFSLTYEAAAAKPVAAFPDFDHLPSSFHVMSFGNSVFAPPQFSATESGSPWVVFDDSGDTCIISPASHYLIQKIGGDAKEYISSELRDTVANIPAGFTQQTLVVSDSGINRTWDEWGKALTDLEGVSRPANDADLGLKYLGYWTDNGSYYYYNYDRDLGYGGTLVKLAQHFRDEQIPVKYLQLDSWWYYKTFRGPDGKIGKSKSAKLPSGKWNRYGGLLEYRADPAVFPDGLEGFQREAGLPLITHNRWIDPASPYQQEYRVSGYAGLDPAYWRDIIGYVAGAGTVTYEQDWLSEIYFHSPDLAANVSAGDEFSDGMSAASASNKMTMQYCMALPSFFLQGSKYPNLTTIRCSDDRLRRERWHNFLFTSRMASALGIWPWTDTYQSSETGNMLLADLSAGMVGFGDAMGKEDAANIFEAVRKDGVIVKPDAVMAPVDSAYIAEANGEHRALVANTWTDHDGVRTNYVLAFRVPPPPKKGKSTPSPELKATEQIAPSADSDVTDSTISAADLGISGPAYVSNFFTGEIGRIDLGKDFTSPLGADGFSYFVIAQPGASGIALFGDADKFVSNGRQRIESIGESPGKLTVTIVFAKGETSVRLHGCCETAVSATVDGQPLNVSYDAGSRHFSVNVDAISATQPADAADGTQRVVVVLHAE